MDHSTLMVVIHVTALRECAHIGPEKNVDLYSDLARRKSAVDVVRGSLRTEN
jgi:hypothetical protein